MELALETYKPTTETGITLADKARAISIVTAADYTNAGMLLQSLKKKKKELDDTRKGQTRPLDEAKEKIMAFFRPAIDAVDSAIKILDQEKMIPWTNEQNRIRQEEEDRLQAEAKKRAEDQALIAAAEAEEAGEHEEAETILTTVQTPTIKIESYVPRSAAAFQRSTWSAEAFDLMETVKAIAEGRAPIEAVCHNMTFLNSQARSYKNKLNIAGVRAIEKKSTTGRG